MADAVSLSINCLTIIWSPFIVCLLFVFSFRTNTATAFGSSVCRRCQPGYYAEPGSSDCTEKHACTLNVLVSLENVSRKDILIRISFYFLSWFSLVDDRTWTFPTRPVEAERKSNTGHSSFHRSATPPTPIP